jgi:predicted phage terminase large subunit-like protein
VSDQDEAFELTMQEWRKKATPAHLAVYTTRDLPDDSEKKWKPYKHHLLMNQILVDAATDRNRRFINLEVAVRHGKSTLTTFYFVVWFLGMFPDRRVAILCHSNDYASEWSEQCRQLFKEFGPELFGLTVSKTQDTKARWDIEGHRGGVVAVGRGASIEGKGFGLVVMDDLLDQQAAESPTEMRKAWEWYQEGLRPRCSPGSTVLMVMSRWRVDDPSGRIEERMAESPDGDRWETIHLPAIAECPRDEDPETWRDLLGRSEGEPLWPEMWVLDDLLQLKATLDSHIWESRYQQNPSPREGGMFKVDAWMRRPAAPDGLRKVRCWDLAATKDGGDYTVGILMGMDAESRAYVLDVQRFRKDGNEVKKQVLATARADGKGVRIRIEQEKAGAGKAQIADYKRMLMGWDVKGVRPEGSKEQRAGPYASAQQDGNIYLVNSLLWDKDFVEEHRVFGPKGRGRHDDQVDAASGAFDELNALPPAEIYEGTGLSADTVVDWVSGSRSYAFTNI